MLEGVGKADGVGVPDGDGVETDTDGVMTWLLAAAFAEVVCVDEFLAVDGVGDAAGPLHPAVNTQKSNTAHTANIAARFFIKLAPRQSDESLRMQKDLLQHT